MNESIIQDPPLLFAGSFFAFGSYLPKDINCSIVVYEQESNEFWHSWDWLKPNNINDIYYLGVFSHAIDIFLHAKKSFGIHILYISK